MQILSSVVVVRDRLVALLQARILKLIDLAKWQRRLLEAAGDIEGVAVDILALRYNDRKPAAGSKSAAVDAREARCRMVRVLGAVAAQPDFDPETCPKGVKAAGSFGTCSGADARADTLLALRQLATLLKEFHCE